MDMADCKDDRLTLEQMLAVPHAFYSELRGAAGEGTVLHCMDERYLLATVFALGSLPAGGVHQVHKLPLLSQPPCSRTCWPACASALFAGVVHQDTHDGAEL